MQALTVSSPRDLIQVLTKQATENYVGSVTFMKQLTVIAVSSIVYLRDAFPEDSYNLERFKELNLRILKMKCRDESAQFLSTALINAFDAFDKKYLHRLVLCFYDDECNPENLIDYHIFEYTYHKEGATLKVHSATDPSAVDENVYSMLQRRIVIDHGAQKKLPASFDISLRLYYNEDAPENYQAPGFASGGDDFEEHLTQADMVTYLVGDVNTPYHYCRMSSHFKEHSASGHEAIASQDPPFMTQNDDFTTTWSSDGAPPAALQCPCGLDEADLPRDVTKLITCNYCRRQQHAACFGLLQPRGRHCCTACSEEDSARAPTDPRLAALDPKKRQLDCLLRLTLAWCAARGEVSEGGLAALGLAPRHVRCLLHYLRAKRVLAHDNWDVTQKVNETGLKDLMKTSFVDVEEEENFMSRLLEETLASQESQRDPVGEVLTPTEMSSLREATSIDRVVGTRPPAAASALLKQYQDAITSNAEDDEDTPLAATLKEMELRRKKRKLEPSATTLRSNIQSKRGRTPFI